MPMHHARFARCRAPHSHGFSLVELLVVLGIIAALTAAAFALFSQDTSVTGKRQIALSLITGTVEQARSRAIAKGVPVYIAIASPEQGPDLAWQALSIYEEAADPTQPPIPISEIRRLPEGMIFYAGTEGLFPQAGSQEPREFLFPNSSTTSPAPYLRFDAQGILQSPPPQADPAGVKLRLCYGTIQQNQPVITRSDSAGTPLLIPLEVTRFTGRVELK